MQETTNYKLKKPEDVDFIDVQDFNDNVDIIDNTLKGLDTDKAALTYVDGKVNILNNTIETKANTTTVNNDLNLKADKTYVDTQVDTKENKATYIAYTMPAWTSSTFTSLESTYPSANYSLEIQLSNSCTSDEIDAWNDAQILGNITNNYLYAKGDYPTISIPIYLKIVEVI